jgi:hypothetical protein
VVEAFSERYDKKVSSPNDGKISSHFIKKTSLEKALIGERQRNDQ